MTRKNLWDIAEKINDELPGDKKSRIILYKGNHHTDEKSAYIFERILDENDMTLGKKIHEMFSAKTFHEKYNKPLILLDNSEDFDYMDTPNIHPMQEDMKDISKKFSEKYGLKYKEFD